MVPKVFGKKIYKISFCKNRLVTNETLEQMRARAIDTRTMMTLSSEEVEHLILNNLVQPGEF